MEWLVRWVKEHLNRVGIALGFLVLLVFTMFLAYFFLAGSKEEAPPEGVLLASVQVEEQSTAVLLPEEDTEPLVESWKADIKGAVVFPGVYEVEPGMRIQDLIDKAGGVRPDAEVRDLNLAMLLADQMMVYVPAKDEGAGAAGEPASDASPLVQAPGQEEGSGGLIDLNTADATELQQLPGIGAKKAELIVQYRQDQGPFQTIEELMLVKGIGEKTFAALEDQITVSQ